jgi:hypothetical protein
VLYPVICYAEYGKPIQFTHLGDKPMGKDKGKDKDKDDKKKKKDKKDKKDEKKGK